MQVAKRCNVAQKNSRSNTRSVTFKHHETLYKHIILHNLKNTVQIKIELQEKQEKYMCPEEYEVNKLPRYEQNESMDRPTDQNVL